VRVRAAVVERAAPALTDKAIFRVTTLGVLGEHYLDIEPLPGGAPLADGARVNGESGARPDLLLARASGLLDRAEQLLPSSPEAGALIQAMTSLVTRLDALLGNEKNAGTAEDVRALVSDLRGLIHGAAVGVGDGASLKRTVDRLPAVLEKTERLEDGLDGARLADLVGDAHATLARLDRTLDLVAGAPVLDAQKQEELRKDLTATLRSLDVTARRADRLLAVVEEKRGGAGQLFWDEAAAADLKAVLRGLRENPVGFLLGREPKEPKDAPKDR
jgi:hypothetical protein